MSRSECVRHALATHPGSPSGTCGVTRGLRSCSPVPGHNSDRGGTIHDFPKGLDSPRLDAPPGCLGRLGPEVHLGYAAGSIGGRGSCGSRPMTRSIRTLEVARGEPFRTPGNLPHGAPHPIALTDREMASHRPQALEACGMAGDRVHRSRLLDPCWTEITMSEPVEAVALPGPGISTT
jgi:hypothetical protein